MLTTDATLFLFMIFLSDLALFHLPCFAYVIVNRCVK